MSVILRNNGIDTKSLDGSDSGYPPDSERRNSRLNGIFQNTDALCGSGGGSGSHEIQHRKICCPEGQSPDWKGGLWKIYLREPGRRCLRKTPQEEGRCQRKWKWR